MNNNDNTIIKVLFQTKVHIQYTKENVKLHIEYK